MIENCVNGTLCFELIKGLPTTLATVVIGGLGAWIATRQYILAKAKLNFDLFEKRYSVFEYVYSLLNTMMSSDNPGRDATHDEVDFRSSTAQFLFRPEIVKYLDELTIVARHVKRLDHMLYDGTASEEDVGILKQKRAWLLEQLFFGIGEMFAPYMKFEKWS